MVRCEWPGEGHLNTKAGLTETIDKNMHGHFAGHFDQSVQFNCAGRKGERWRGVEGGEGTGEGRGV